MDSIPKIVTEGHPIGGLLPPDIAEYSQRQDAPETQPFVISFEEYNEKECEIDALIKNNGKKFLKILKDIGKRAYSHGHFKGLGITATPIKRSGAYICLYKGRSLDAEIFEIHGSGTSRIFYFIIQLTVYIVAIKENHIETNKHRKG
jgi:hypothetical protein